MMMLVHRMPLPTAFRPVLHLFNRVWRRVDHRELAALGSLGRLRPAGQPVGPLLPVADSRARTRVWWVIVEARQA